MVTLEPSDQVLLFRRRRQRKEGYYIVWWGFLEKATKRIEEDKALAKVIGAQKTPCQQNDVNTLRTPETFAVFGQGHAYLVQWQETTVPTTINRYHNSRGGQNPKYPQQQTGPPKKQSK